MLEAVQDLSGTGRWHVWAYTLVVNIMHSWIREQRTGIFEDQHGLITEAVT